LISLGILGHYDFENIFSMVYTNYCKSQKALISNKVTSEIRTMKRNDIFQGYLSNQRLWDI